MILQGAFVATMSDTPSPSSSPFPSSPRLGKTPSPATPPESQPREPIVNLPAPILWVLLITVAMHILRLILPPAWENELVVALVLIPLRYSDQVMFELSALIPPLGHVLVHWDWMHLLMNMMGLIIFGTALTRWRGTWQFFLVYGAGAIGGAVFYLLVSQPEMELVAGASSAISALIGSFLWLLRDSQAAMGRRFNILALAAGWVVISLVFDLVIAGGPADEPIPIAWEAHLGGFFTGLLLIPLLPRPPQHPLVARPLSSDAADG